MTTKGGVGDAPGTSTNEEDSSPGWSDEPSADTLDRNRTAETVAQALFGLGDAVKVGRFSVLERRGSGAMGIVYSAWDPRLQRRVAIKVLKQRGAAVDRILDEARATAKLNHPNVVTVYDADNDEGRPYIAMEYIEGVPLR
ncbi:MAG: protein kinase, partial [Myxococcota bacterium]